MLYKHSPLSNFSCYFSIKPSFDAYYSGENKNLATHNVLRLNMENIQIVLPEKETQARSENSIADRIWNTYSFSR